MLTWFKNLSHIEKLVLAGLASILVGFAGDAEVLALLPPVWKLLLSKAVLYGMGGGVLYNMSPNKGAGDQPK